MKNVFNCSDKLIENMIPFLICILYIIHFLLHKSILTRINLRFENINSPFLGQAWLFSKLRRVILIFKNVTNPINLYSNPSKILKVIFIDRVACQILKDTSKPFGRLRMNEISIIWKLIIFIIIIGRIQPFLVSKRAYFAHYSLDKGLKGTVANLVWHLSSFFIITTTVPLRDVI